MKQVNSLIIALIIAYQFLVSCKTNDVPARISNELKNKKISELTVNTQKDSISYALGIVWSYNLQRIGMISISNAFYYGAYDYIHNRDIITTFEKADIYLEERYPDIQELQRKFPLNDDQLLKKIELSTPFDTFSYSLGYTWSRIVYNYGIDDITPVLLTGLISRLKGVPTLLDQKSSDMYLRAYIENKRLVMFADIKEKNEAWLVENAKKPGVIEHPSGIQYKVLKQGKGKKSDTTDIFQCYYTTRLIDGTIVDSMYASREPLKFYIQAVTPGLAEAVLSMREGDRWEVYIPSKLAHGSDGIQNKVSPYSTIIMDIELVKLEKQK